VAAGARADLEQHVALVVGVLGHELDLELLLMDQRLLAQPLELGARELADLQVLLVHERFVVGDLPLDLAVDAPGVDQRLEARTLPRDLLEATLVADDRGIREILGETLEMLLGLVELGDDFGGKHKGSRYNKATRGNPRSSRGFRGPGAETVDAARA